MAGLTYYTAGESHGPALTTLVLGMPAGVPVDEERINAALARRQGGYGRGGRMRIERDTVEVLSGVRHGLTMGSPVTLRIVNRDSRLEEAPPVHRPRPGHADLAGSCKWNTDDCRNVLERASARETAARTAAGALASGLLAALGIECVGYVVQIGPARMSDALPSEVAELRRQRDANEAYCPDQQAAAAMIDAIRQAKIDKDTLGGIVEVRVTGHPPGLGSCADWRDRLDGRLLQAVGSIQAIKGVEIGEAWLSAGRPGSAVHDEIHYDASQSATASAGFVRPTNRAGGLEGGMTNGAPVVVRAAMKPISTLLQGVASVNLQTRQPERSDYERSDVCAVPAASVVAEQVVAFEMARALEDKFGGDTLEALRASLERYLAGLRDGGETTA